LEGGTSLAIDVSAAAASRRRVDLQGRLEQAAQRIGGGYESAKQLFREIRSYLINAYDRELIVEGQALIYKQLLFGGPDRDGCFDIAIGTARNFHRTRDLPHFTRRD